MEDTGCIESFFQSTDDNAGLTTGNHSAEEDTNNKLRRDTGLQMHSQDVSQLSTVFPSIESLETDGIGSNPVVQHVQGPTVSVPGMLHQPALIDGIVSTAHEPRVLIKKKGRFTVTPDALPSTPKMVERSASVNSAQTTPTTIQKGRFTVTPDTDAGLMYISSDNSAATAPIFVAPGGVVAPPKVEKKGRFVVSSAVPSGLVIDSEISLSQTFERPSSIAIPVTTAPHTKIEPLGQQPHPAPPVQSVSHPVTVGNVVSTDQTIASLSGSEEKSTIMSGGSGVTRLGKPPASFDSKGVGSNVGLGKVFYFLEQMKAEVSEADRNTKLLQKEVKFLKEKNKELEAKSREMEKRWKDQKANREAAEAKVRLLKKKLRELKHEGNEDELLGENINDTHCEPGVSSRSSSIGESEEVSKLNTIGCNTDSIPDVLEKLSSMDGPSAGAQSRRRASNDIAGMQTPSKSSRVSSVEADKSHSSAATATAASVPQKPAMSANSRPPMAESRHARHWSGSSITAGSGNTSQISDEGPQNFVNPTHKRASSNSETSIVGVNLNEPSALVNGAVGINGTSTQQHQPGVALPQKPQQAWNQGQYPIIQQQQSLQKPPINAQQGTGMNHQVIQQGLQQPHQPQQQQGMPATSQRQSQQGLQVLTQQQPHGVATLSPQLHQQSAHTTQLLPQHQSSHGMSMISQPQQQTQAMTVAQQKAMGMQQAFVTQQQSHTPQKLQAQSAVSHPQSLAQQHQGIKQSVQQHQHTSPLQQQTKAQQQQSSTPHQLQPGMQQQLPSLQHQLQISQPLQHQQQQQGPLPIQTIPGIGGTAPLSQQQQPFSSQFNAQQQQSMQQPALNGLQWS